jgi:hypothetical protein
MFQNILDFQTMFTCYLKKMLFENFNIPTNNITSVKAAKVLGIYYLSNIYHVNKEMQS